MPRARVITHLSSIYSSVESLEFLNSGQKMAHFEAKSVTFCDQILDQLLYYVLVLATIRSTALLTTLNTNDFNMHNNVIIRSAACN